VIAKAVRKQRSRKSGHLELFAHVKLSLARSRSSWDIITQAETVAPNAPLRDDLARGTYARYAVELYDRFVTEGEGGQSLFDLMERMMHYLCQEGDLELLARAFEQRLLSLAGFRAEWDRCVGERGGHICELPLDPDEAEGFGLDPERGGALCGDCHRASQQDRGVISLAPATLRLLRACQRESFSQLRRRHIPPRLMWETERAARHYITYHLEHDLRTAAFLRRLRREGKHRPASD
jgi:DNA repair protein RecO (recombination protein O)